MKRDKEEFKAKNREESFIKDKRPDIQLGRLAEPPQERRQASQSRKNRMYQARQEYKETITVTAETPNKADLGMDFTEQESLSENPQEQAANDEQPEQTQEDFSELADSGSQDRNTDMPKHEPPKQTVSKKNRVYQKHTKTAQKPVDLDIPQKTAEQPPDEMGEPLPQEKADDYNIRDAVQDNKAEFKKNTDVDFSRVSADKDSNIPFERVQTSGNKRIDNLQLTIDNDSKKMCIRDRDRDKADEEIRKVVYGAWLVDAEQCGNLFARDQRQTEKSFRMCARACRVPC